MEEDTEYLKLPLEDRCIHKLWKARVHGYEECKKYFPQITDEKSSEFSKFAPLMKKFASDSNAVALDKALDAVLAFAENAHISIAGRTAGDVASGIVSKCLAAPKKTTQDKALTVILMYCEIEKYDAVQEELIKGFGQKNPKVVCGCVRALTTLLREFGNKVISIKLLVKSMGALLEDRDKNIREEAKKMVIEMYRWAGPALKPQLNSLKPIQIQELETEFEKLPNEKPIQIRYLRSQQEKKARAAVQGDSEEENNDDTETDVVEDIDPLDLMSPVNILDQLPKDFFTMVEEKKWQDRKQALEILLPLSLNEKLEPGDYADLVKALKKIIGKDTNVMIVALAGQCIGGLAKGLRKKFSMYSIACIETMLGKFKEKKIMVVKALREAVDAVFLSSSIESIQEVTCAALNNKNPSVKAESIAFLARSFAYCTPIMLPKKLLKLYITDLIKTLNESDPNVRENSAEALGTILKVVGEKIMDAFLTDIEEIKMQKIKEYAEKVEIKVKFKAPKPKPVTKNAPSVSKPANKAKIVKPSSIESKKPATSRPLSSVGNTKKSSASKSTGIRGGGGGAPKVEECSEFELSNEEALEKAQEVLSEELVAGLSDSNWKTRLSAVDDMYNTIQAMDDIPTQALIKILTLKPGLKDNNFQVMKIKLDVIKFLAENSTFTSRSAEACLSDLIDKFGDPKNGSFIGEVLTAISEATKLEYVGIEVMNLALAQKNPKIQEVAIKWLSDSIKEFGFIFQPKSLISNIKAALSHSNVNVRTAAITLCGTIYIYIGPSLRAYFDDEKSSVLQQIDSEFEKMIGVSPPTPTRGKNKDSSTESVENYEAVEDDEHCGTDIQDTISRINISDQITSTLISELADKNWKVRIEALSKVASIINAAKFITSDIGELPTAICARLTETNKNIAAEALRITSSLAAALGPHCKQHSRILIPGIFSAFGDAKQSMRQQALVALNNWVDHLGSVKDIIDGDMCIDALKSGTPFLKTELIMWMSLKLKDAPVKSINKDELNGCVGYLLSGIEDRNPDIRKASNEAIFPFMLHVGYDAMVRHTSKVKPSSKNTVIQALEKAKSLMPIRSAPHSARVKAPQVGRSAAGPEKSVSKGPAVRRGAQRAHSASKNATNSKKEEDADYSPLLQVNNIKQQRILEEQRLRTLKWDMSTSPPRPELISQLKDQMAAANMNRQLMTNMFHQDFKYHIKAIDNLADDFLNNVDACVANLDLILRWLTIRFFDTNPSVILKAMEYLKNIFSTLSDGSYTIVDYEAYSFLPTIIMKFGDPKDSIRGPARNIVKLICNIYPANKVSSYVLEGLKSKNARQRAECLETIGSLIEYFGISVCQPSPAQALKDVAKQIADRDNSVRNAALNCLLEVYFREGDKVYKLIGQVSAKDQSLLEERIKRSTKNRPIIKKSPEPDPVAVRVSGFGGGRKNRVIPTVAAQPGPVLRDGLSNNVPSNNNSSLRRYGQGPLSGDPSNINSRIHIDYEYLEQLVEDKLPLQELRTNVALEEIPDMSSILNDVPSYLPTSRLIRPSYSSSAMRANAINANLDLEEAFQAINYVISQVGSNELKTVIAALSQIDEVIKCDDKRGQLVMHVDQLLTIATLQYTLVLKSKMTDDKIPKVQCVKIYRSLTHCVMNIFNNTELGTKATRDVLHGVIHIVLSILLDSRLGELEDGNQVIRALNVLVVRIIEKAQYTQVFSALLKLLYESIDERSVNTSYTELVMKCNWKGIRILPARKHDLDPVQILQDVHKFLVRYPANIRTEKSSTVALRTIRTVLHNLVIVYGRSITTHLAQIPGVDGSEIQKYIQKALNSVHGSTDKAGANDSNRTSVTNDSNRTSETDDSNRTSEAQQLTVDSDTYTAKSPRRLSKAANTTLSEIFQKIGSKENTKEGIIQLYEFKQKNPNDDIDSYLRKSSLFFQNYIERGLKRVEAERQAESKMSISASSDGSTTSAPLASIQVKDDNNVNVNVNELVDQFKVIAAQAGFDNSYIDTAVKDICSHEQKTTDFVATKKKPSD